MFSETANHCLIHIRIKWAFSPAQTIFPQYGQGFIWIERRPAPALPRLIRKASTYFFLIYSLLDSCYSLKFTHKNTTKKNLIPPMDLQESRTDVLLKAGDQWGVGWVDLVDLKHDSRLGYKWRAACLGRFAQVTTGWDAVVVINAFWSP